MTQPSRNAACHCGSGRRFEDCHGSIAPASADEGGVGLIPPAQLAEAADALRRGNLALADMLCRGLLERFPTHPAVLMLLGEVAFRAGCFDFAVDYLSEALRRAPLLQGARSALDRAQAAVHERRRSSAARAVSSRPRVLLIKAWGYGFWSDVDHVLGQLLVADMTDRTPIAHWGSNSLFSAPGVDNAFESYFLPVAHVALDHVIAPDATFYPPKWRYDNLAIENLNKFDGPGSRLTGLYFLSRDEDVVVSDFHTAVNDLLPWLRPGSQYFGLPREEVYRRLFTRHLRLKPHLEARIDDVWQEKLAGRRWLAVHVRGSDKITEVGDLARINAAYFDRVDRIIAARPELSIFLLTDSERALQQFRARYGARLLCLSCTRSATTTGVHYSGHPGQRIAEEVIVDTYIAARCELFLGNGGSNVSTTVRHLKAWAPGSYSLIGEDFLGSRNLFLNRW